MPHETTAKKRAFLKAFRRAGSVVQAAKEANVNRRTHYRWLESDPDYSERFAIAKEDVADRFEAEADRRAIQGVARMKFHQGQPIMVRCDPDDPDAVHAGTDDSGNPIWQKPYVERQYSDTLLMFRSKALRPEKYRERYKQNPGKSTDMTDARLHPPDGDPSRAKRLPDRSGWRERRSGGGVKARRRVAVRGQRVRRDAPVS